MVRGFTGAPAIHMVHREPLRADELDRQVIKGMTGFEFGTEEEIERKLVHVLESDAYIRALQYWERKRSMGNLNGNGGRWGDVSNSSLAISFDSNSGGKSDSTAPRKSRRFSGFDYYRRKLFSPATSSPGSPQGHSPPNSQNHLAHPSFSDSKNEPLDPTRGFHPLISMYYLAREKLERDRVYGPGQFASSQLSITGEVVSPTALHMTTPVDDASMRQQQYAATQQPHFTAPVNVKKDNSQPATKLKSDYSMPLPRLPAPETSHYSGLSYDHTPVSPSPTSPSFAQPRARDLGLPPPSPSAQQRQHIEIAENAMGGQKRDLPRVPPPSTHHRSHSMSQRPTTLSRGWGGMFGGGGGGDHSADEQGVNRLPEPPKTAGPDTSTFSEKTDENGEKHHEHASPFSSGATLVRKFGSMLVGSRGEEGKKHGTLSGKRGTILAGLSPSPRPSETKSYTSDVEEKTLPTPADDEKEPSSMVASPKPIASSASQPVGNVHRRAATILDPQGHVKRHERRSSTGAAFMGGSTGGTIGRHRRPSTGYGSSRPLADRLFSKAGPEVDVREKKEEEDIVDDQRPDITVQDAEETFHEEDERHTSEKDFKPVFLKGLFRYLSFLNCLNIGRSNANRFTAVWRQPLPSHLLRSRRIFDGFWTECRFNIEKPRVDLSAYIYHQSIFRQSKLAPLGATRTTNNSCRRRREKPHQ